MAMRRLALALVLLAGCATAGLPKCPKNGGPAWRRIETEHFALSTDLPATRAAEAGRELEYMRSALTRVLVPDWDGPPGRIPVVILSGDGHFNEFFPAPIIGIFTELLLSPIVVMSGTASMSRQALIKHELTHFLVDDYVPIDRLPRWVAEGLASFTQTVEVDRRAGKVTVGKTDDDLVLFALAKYFPQRIMMHYNVGVLLLNTEATFYATSWVKVHYLLNHHGEAFGVYLRALHDGERDSAAWAKAFPDLSQDALERAMPDYVRGGKYRVVTLDLPVHETAVSESPIEDAAVHGWRALLYVVKSKRAKLFEFERRDRAMARAREEVAEAVRQDPGDVLALAAQVYAGDKVDVARARVATEAHPDAWLPWYVLGEAYKRAGDSKASWEALKEALRRAGDNPAIRLMDTLREGRGARHEAL